MSLSDCEKCWDTPCTCGYEYRNYSEERIIDWIENILKYHDRGKILNQLMSKNIPIKQGKKTEQIEENER